jgi:tripartite-type tricarboxylate transporter receptor subunit TctC
MRKPVVASVLLLGAALAFQLSPATAQSVADFYKDKQIKIVIGNAAGGDYDIGGRILARHLGSHIPGNPTVVVQNMPGASTVTATNFLYNKAPKDGTVIGSFSRNIASQAVIGKMNIEADPRKFGWIGGSSLPSRVCMVSSKSGVTSPQDVFTREVIVAGSGAGSSLSIVPSALNNLLGAKFKVVEGYQGSGAAMLALERGEVEGICHTHGVFQSHHAQMVKDGVLKILFHVEEADFPDDPTVPSIYKFAKTDKQKQMLRFLFSSTEFGRPYVAPPGVPAERLAALRKAFADALKDPALIEEANKSSVDMTYRPPEELEKLVEALYATPKETIEELEKIVPASGLQ